MDAKRIEELRRLASVAAFPGAWEAKAVADFASAARTALPELLAEVERLTSRVEMESDANSDTWAETEALQAELAIAKAAITLTPDEARDVLAVLEMAAPIVGGASTASAPAYERRQRVEDACALLKGKVFG